MRSAGSSKLFDGRALIADTSAWSKARQLPAGSDWELALRAGQIGTCAPVKLELLAGTRSPAEFADWEGDLNALPQYESNGDTWKSALTALRDLANSGSHGLQRQISPTDAVVAALAARECVGVLHYDDHFDRLARVLDFESVWLRPRGDLN